jgi:hypothetical protein
LTAMLASITIRRPMFRMRAQLRRRAPSEGFLDVRFLAPVPGGSPLQARDQLVVQIAHMQISSHMVHRGIKAIGQYAKLTKSRSQPRIRSHAGGGGVEFIDANGRALPACVSPIRR